MISAPWSSLNVSGGSKVGLVKGHGVELSAKLKWAEA